MKPNPGSVFHTVLHNIHETTPYITESVSLYPESVHLQMEEISQEIQDATTDYLINSPSTNINLLDTVDETINYIEALLQTNHSYPGPMYTPNSKIPSISDREHLTPDLRAESRATTADTDTTFVTNMGSADTMSTLYPAEPISDSTEEPPN